MAARLARRLFLGGKVMTDPVRIHRQQLVREAEGYLDLATAFSEHWPLPTDVRDALCLRAIATLERVEHAGGMSGQIFFLHGQALRHMLHYGEAIPFFCAAAEHDPSNVHIYLSLAWCYKRIRRLDLAIESLESALQEEPGLAILHYNLACYWALAGNVRCCVRYLSQSFDLEPNYRDLIHKESDFDSLRNHPQFLNVMSAAC